MPRIFGFLSGNSVKRLGSASNISPYLVFPSAVTPSVPTLGDAVVIKKPIYGGIPSVTVTLTSFTKNGVNNLSSLVFDSANQWYVYNNIGEGSYVATWQATNGAGLGQTVTTTTQINVVSNDTIFTFDKDTITFDTLLRSFDEDRVFSVGATFDSEIVKFDSTTYTFDEA